jgi:hypothetical protein
MRAVRAKEALGCYSDCQTLNALNAMYGQHAALGPQQCGRLLQEWMGNQLTETSSTAPQPAAAPDDDEEEEDERELLLDDELLELDDEWEEEEEEECELLEDDE